MSNTNYYYYGNSSQSNIDTTVEDMQNLCREAMSIANNRMLYCPDFGISDGLRTEAEQKARYAKGRDQYGRILYLGLVITYCDGVTDLSDHQSGHAIDFFAVHPVTKKTSYEPYHMLAIYSCFAEAAMKLGLIIEWGGNYSTFEDLGHIAIKGKL